MSRCLPPSLLAALLLAACASTADGRPGPSQPPPTPASAPAPAAAPAPGGDEVLVRWSEGQLTRAEIEARITAELRAIEVEYLTNRYERLAQAAEGLLDEALLEAEAKRKGVTVDALLLVEIEQKTPAPSDEAVAAFYGQVQSQLGGASLDEAKPMLARELQQRAMGDTFRAYIAGLRQQAGASVTVPYPDLPRAEVPVADHDATLGSADARVTIVQFAEYECYYCGKVNETIAGLRQKYGDQVRFVFKDYPLPSHPRAIPAAVAAHCAGEQGKYWEMNARLLANQRQLGDADLRAHADAVGVKAKPFEDCMQSGKWEPTIQQDVTLAQSVGVSATPTFFINGMLLAGAQPIERFQAVIDQELAK